MAKIENIPKLPGYVNITEAAEILGISRQQMYREARRGDFKSLRQVGTKSFYVVGTEELEQVLQRRQ